MSADERVLLGDRPLSTIYRSAESYAMEECWKQLRGGALVPVRQAVTAQSIPKTLLPGIGICSVEATESVFEGSYRLAGTRYRKLTGIELSGNKHRQIVVDGNMEERANLICAVLKFPVGVWWVSQVLIGTEYYSLYQSTILPLCSDDCGRVDHFIDFLECDIPIIAQGQPNVLSDRIVTYRWIDIGAGAPSTETNR
jgi:hypothetical protein